MTDAAGKTGGVRRVALVINGDHAEHHRENAAIATRELSEQGYEVRTLSHEMLGSGGDSQAVLKAIKKLRNDEKIDADDEIVVYFTGHGDITNGEPGVALRDRTLFASEFVDDLKALPCETTVVMDQCYSGNFAQLFADEPDLRFIGLSGKGLTDSCRPFAPRFWNPDAKADDDGDGHISWQERFDWATEDSKKIEYSLAVYFSGSDLKEKHFSNDVKTVHTRKALDAELAKLEAGEHAIVLYSAPWCSACQAYKPQFKALSDGRYKFIIADAEDPSIFPIPQNTPVPHIRLYGYGLHTNGIELQRSERLVDEMPLYLSARTPDILAKQWIVSGTEEQQRTAVLILGELLPEDDRSTFYASLVQKDDLATPARMKAVQLLGNIASEYNIGNAYEKLVEFMRSDTLTTNLRAECAAMLINWSIIFRDTNISDSAKSFLRDIMMSDIEVLSPFAQYITGYTFKIDNPESRKFISHIIATRKPHDLALGLMRNDETTKLFGKEIIEIALDDSANIDLRYSAIQKEKLPWVDGERAKALETFLLSKNVPMQDKIDRLASNSGRGTIAGVAYQCMNDATRHRMAIKFYQSGAPLNGKTISFFTSMLNKTGDQEVVMEIANRAMKAITDGKYDSVESFFRFLAQFKTPKRVEFFSKMLASNQPERTRIGAIRYSPANIKLTKKLIAIATDEKESETIRFKTIETMGRCEDSSFISTMCKLADNATDPSIRYHALRNMWKNRTFNPYHLKIISSPQYNDAVKENAAYKLSGIDVQSRLCFDPKTNPRVREVLIFELACNYEMLPKNYREKLFSELATGAINRKTRINSAFNLPPPALLTWLRKYGKAFDGGVLADHIKGVFLSTSIDSYNTPENRAALRGILSYFESRKGRLSTTRIEDVYESVGRGEGDTITDEIKHIRKQYPQLLHKEHKSP